MKRTAILIITAFICLHILAQTGRTTVSMDKDWRFKTGTFQESIDPSFDDSQWRQLDVPHDWSIEGRYNKYNKTGRGGAKDTITV